jgi:hypothetical protein
MFILIFVWACQYCKHDHAHQLLLGVRGNDISEITTDQYQIMLVYEYCILYSFVQHTASMNNTIFITLYSPWRIPVCKHTRWNGKFVNIPAPCDPPGSSPCTRRATPTGKMQPNTALATIAVTSTLPPRHRAADAFIII